jgi:hypothetical protein
MKEITDAGKDNEDNPYAYSMGLSYCGYKNHNVETSVELP